MIFVDVFFCPIYFIYVIQNIFHITFFTCRKDYIDKYESTVLKKAKVKQLKLHLAGRQKNLVKFISSSNDIVAKIFVRKNTPLVDSETKNECMTVASTVLFEDFANKTEVIFAIKFSLASRIIITKRIETMF